MRVNAIWQKFWQDPNGAAKLSPLLHSRLFWAVLALKLVAGSLFASDYLWNLFIPFIDHFVHAPLENPYAYFWDQGNMRIFPYPAMMLYIMAAPRLLLQPLMFDAWPHALQLLAARLPLIAADIVILAVLVRWFRGKSRLLIGLYWCAPALFYITYLHGQLDVIPIALLFVSLYWLFSERLVGASLVLGLALATKTHLVLVVPFFLIYIYRREWRAIPVLRHTALIAAAFIAPNIFYLGDAGFMNMVFHNTEQSKLMAAAVPFMNGAEFYLIVAAYIFLIFRAGQMTLQNRDLFLMFLGFSFGALTFFIAPMPGWYYWIVPFLVYFYACSGGQNGLLLLLLQGLYLLYFALIPASDYLQIFQVSWPEIAARPNIYRWLDAHGGTAQIILNVVFTLLQTVLLLNCAYIYRRGIKGAQKHKFTSRSFLLGIAGDSGSGKTTLAAALLSLFGPRTLLAICGDDMHKWARGHEKWQRFTHLDPKANALHRELEHLSALRQRRPISRRLYDHASGQFTDVQQLKALPIVVFEGLHSFYLQPAQDMFDLKVFVAPDADLLTHRKIVRDMAARGYSREKVLSLIEQRAGDSAKYIKVQEQKADIVVAVKLQEPIAEIGNAAIEPKTYLHLRLSNAFYLDPILDDLAVLLGSQLTHDYDSEGHQSVDFFAVPIAPELAALAEKHLPGLSDLGIYDPVLAPSWNGILQLMLAYCIFFEARRNEG